MAAASRTALLRSTQLLNPSKRFFSSTTQPLRLLRPIPSISSRAPLAPARVSIASRIAPFSSTAQKNILPAGPQVVEGTLNDPAPVPTPSPLHGSYHWTFERLLAVGLVPLTIAPFAAGSLNPALDAALIFSVIVHSHIGFQACIIDYIPPRRYGTLRKICDWLLNIATLVVGVGFYEFETNDVGVTEAIKRIWTA